jgi:hypothetical protein
MSRCGNRLALQLRDIGEIPRFADAPANHGTDLTIKWAGALVLASMAVACASPEAVRITDRCEPITDAVLLRQTAGNPGRWSLGMVDGQLLFSYTSYPGTGEATSERAQWFDESFTATTPDFWIGDGRAVVQPDWAGLDGMVWAQIWVERITPLGPIRTEAAIWSLQPGSTMPTRTAVHLPITHVLDGDPGVTPVQAASAATSGGDGRGTVAVSDGRPVFAINAWLAACDTPTVQAMRIITFDQTSAVADLSGDDPCAQGVNADGRLWAHDMRLVPLRNGELGIFFRLGEGVGQGQVHYSRVGADLAMLDTPPLRVDDETVPWPIPGGFQPQAVALGSGPLLYTLRNPESATSECQDLRLVNPDGRNARDAPYQMRCRPPRGALNDARNGPYLSQWVVLQPLSSGHAVIAYGERTNYSPPGTEYVHRLTSSEPWEEGVFLHTIDDAGRRASEIIRVTPDASTATLGAGTPRTATDGPFPGEYEVQAVSEDDDVVVAWFDRRPEAPGYYARRYRCHATGLPP